MDATLSAASVPWLARRMVGGRVYYGWWIAGACAALMFAGVGVGYYGLAVLLRPLQEQHGWSNATVSGATGLYFSVSGLAGAVAGARIDRFGPRRIMAAGCVVLGAGIPLVGVVQTRWQLYLLYTVLAVGFGSGVSVGVNAVMARWFVLRRARAMSISSTGVSVGGVVLAPVATVLVEWGGVSAAAIGMGALVLVVAVPAVLLVLVFDPADVGLRPDGDPPPDVPVRTTLTDEVQRRPWTRADAARTPAFWMVLTGFVLVMAAQTGFVIHQISFLEDRLGSRSAAAFALSTTAFGSIVARLVVGIFADRIDKRVLTCVLFGVQGMAVLGVLATESVAVTYVLVLVFGFTIGNIYMMQSLVVGEIFGVVSFGAIFGLVSLASQVASGFGPYAVGALETATGGYTVPFVATALVTFAAAGFIAAVRPPSSTPGNRARTRNVAPGEPRPRSLLAKVR